MLSVFLKKNNPIIIKNIPPCVSNIVKRALLRKSTRNKNDIPKNE
jgi:hypothetical protein